MSCPFPGIRINPPGNFIGPDDGEASLGRCCGQPRVLVRLVCDEDVLEGDVLHRGGG
jgi:hypothetical protein